MENNEELVEQTENTELTAEEIEDVESIEEQPQEETTEPIEETFTREQVDNMIAKRLARKEAKIRKEYEKKYGSLENVVNAGLGTENIDEAVTKLTDFYTQKGINIPKLGVNEEVESNAAKWEAEKIIESGYDEIVEEVDDLAKIGVENMTLGEKVKFKMLAEERQRLEEEKELKAIGVEKLDDEFKEFSKKLNPELSLKEKYELYQKTKPKEIKKMGSMKSGQPSEIKQYYTNEEIDKMSLDDLDKPGVWEAVRESMTHNS
jgi:hypothetical protein